VHASAPHRPFLGLSPGFPPNGGNAIAVIIAARLSPIGRRSHLSTRRSKLEPVGLAARNSVPSFSLEGGPGPFFKIVIAFFILLPPRPCLSPPLSLSLGSPCSSLNPPTYPVALVFPPSLLPLRVRGNVARQAGIHIHAE